jgi:hypothetical protein
VSRLWGGLYFGDDGKVEGVGGVGSAKVRDVGL